MMTRNMLHPEHVILKLFIWTSCSFTHHAAVRGWNQATVQRDEAAACEGLAEEDMATSQSQRASVTSDKDSKLEDTLLQHLYHHPDRSLQFWPKSRVLTNRTDLWSPVCIIIIIIIHPINSHQTLNCLLTGYSSIQSCFFVKGLIR